MKKYTRPDVKSVKFDMMDIITASGMIVNAETFTGANAEMYEVYKNNSSAQNTNVSVFTW